MNEKQHQKWSEFGRRGPGPRYIHTFSSKEERSNKHRRGRRVLFLRHIWQATPLPELSTAPSCLSSILYVMVFLLLPRVGTSSRQPFELRSAEEVRPSQELQERKSIEVRHVKVMTSDKRSENGDGSHCSAAPPTWRRS